MQFPHREDWMAAAGWFCFQIPPSSGPLWHALLASVSAARATVEAGQSGQIEARAVWPEYFRNVHWTLQTLGMEREHGSLLLGEAHWDLLRGLSLPHMETVLCVVVEEVPVPRRVMRQAVSLSLLSCSPVAASLESFVYLFGQ